MNIIKQRKYRKEYYQKHKEEYRLYNQKPEVKAKKKARAKKPEAKAKKKLYMKDYRKEYFSRPKVIAKRKARQAKRVLLRNKQVS